MRKFLHELATYDLHSNKINVIAQHEIANLPVYICCIKEKKNQTKTNSAFRKRALTQRLRKDSITRVRREGVDWDGYSSWITVKNIKRCEMCLIGHQ